ncbi:hypothetical protein PQX77_002123, partial [Marasmius sp. AFHP31]
MNNFFANVHNLRIGGYASIQNVAGNATTNIYNDNRGDLVNLYGSVFRRIPMGDIIVRKNVSSDVLEVTADSQHRSSISGTAHVQPTPLKAVKVKKTMQH